MVYREIIYDDAENYNKGGVNTFGGGGSIVFNSENIDTDQNHGFTNCLENLVAASKF
jgi:hypothetical protein